jgi:L-seryl-tRNA(Ser) seleniumtransferase
VYTPLMAAPRSADRRRRLPSVDQVLHDPRTAELVGHHGRAVVRRVVRALLEEARMETAAGGQGDLDVLLPRLPEEVAARVRRESRPSLRRVLNATGVVVHTNLGRAPLSPQAAAHVARTASSYSNLEYDLAAGDRGRREAHAEARLGRLLGTEAALVVNNCAAAVLLALNTLAEGREVLVSRGELVEIGGSFRIPEILGKGGARLREVGTTNRTRLSDYERAIGPDTALILRVHPSNFRIVGFTEAPALEELAGLARAARIPLVLDQGSGLLDPLPGPLREEPTVADGLRAGADVVTFSADKLLGGPQAGLAAGRRALVDALRTNPLYRALRADKMALAALEVVLADHEAGAAAERVPVRRMLALSEAEIRARAAAFADRLRAAGAGPLSAELREGESAVGGGASPARGRPTVLLALAHAAASPDRFAAALRAGEPPVVARLADERVLLDLRTIEPSDEPELLAAVLAAAAAL